MRQKIAHLKNKLEGQNIAPLWALANEELILNVAQNKKHIWKNKSKMVFLLIRVASSLRVTDLPIFLVGFYKISVFFLKLFVYSNEKTSKKNHKKIFVCHGANAEKFIFRKYANETQYSILKINVITLENDCARWGISLITLLISLIKNTVGISDKIRRLSAELKVNPDDFLTVATLNIGEYVFFREFFRVAKKKGVDEAVFLALHVAAHACIDEKIKITYLSHGLIKLSILMAKPDHVVVLTEDERKYLKHIFNEHVVLELIDKPKSIDALLRNSVVVISPEILKHFSKETQENFFEFLTWAESKKLDVILRPSPKISEREYAALKTEFPNACMDNIMIDLCDSLPIIKPKLIVGFNSTCFVTSLDMGILPVSFCDPHQDACIYNMIYPINKRALFWSRDKAMIENALNSNTLYMGLISQLKGLFQDEIYL